MDCNIQSANAIAIRKAIIILHPSTHEKEKHGAKRKLLGFVYFKLSLSFVQIPSSVFCFPFSSSVLSAELLLDRWEFEAEILHTCILNLELCT